MTNNFQVKIFLSRVLETECLGSNMRTLPMHPTTITTRDEMRKPTDFKTMTLSPQRFLRLMRWRTKGAQALLKGLPTSLDEEGPCSTADCLQRAIHETQEANKATICTPPSRNIRFDLSRNQTFPAASHCLTDDEIRAAWWTPRDCENATMVYMQQVIECRLDHPDAVEDLQHVISLCNQSSSDTLEDKDAHTQIPLLARGMESDVAPLLKTLRRKHANAVMDYIGKIPKQLPSDLRDRMLSARSLQYSRPHKILAHVLGQADHAAALLL
jgi:hypothetical protein